MSNAERFPLADLTEKIRAINELIVSGEYHTAAFALTDAQAECDKVRKEMGKSGYTEVALKPFVAYGHQIGFSYDFIVADGTASVSGSTTPRAK